MTKSLIAEIGFRRWFGECIEMLYLSSGRGYAHPSAPSFFFPLIDEKSSLILDQQVFTADRLWGFGQGTYATLVVGNRDGVIDFLEADNCGLYGHKLKISEINEDDEYAAASPIITGTAKGFSLTDEIVTISIVDESVALLDKQVRRERYSGSSISPDGVEGNSGGEISGKWKPLLVGVAANIPAICCNTSKLIYQISGRRPDGRSSGIINMIYDKGVSLTSGMHRNSLNDLLSNIPAPHCWDWCNSSDGLYFRLGSSPSGDVTADAAFSEAQADCSPARVWAWVLTWLGGVPDSKIYTSDLNTLDALQAGICGCWIGHEDVVVRKLADQAAADAGAVSWQMPDGSWRIKRVSPPAVAAAIATCHVFSRDDPGGVGEVDIRDLKILETGNVSDLPPVNAMLDAAPASQVTIDYAPITKVQNRDSIAGQLLMTEERLQRLERTYITLAGQINAKVTDVYPNSAPLSQVVTLRNLINVTAELDNRRVLFETRRTRYQLIVSIIDLSELQIMDVLMIRYPRWGLKIGKPVLVTGLRRDYLTGDLTINAWG